MILSAEPNVPFHPLTCTCRHDHGNKSANPLVIQQPLESIPCKVSIMKTLSRIVQRTALLPTIISIAISITSVPSCRTTSRPDSLRIAPELLKISLDILRPDRLPALRERLQETLDLVLEVIVHHDALYPHPPLPISHSPKTGFLSTGGGKTYRWLVRGPCY